MDVKELQKESALDVYVDKKNIKRALTISLVIIIAGVVLFSGFYFGFFRQGYYALQNSINDKVKTDLGVYVGNLDFGVFSGKGTFNFSSGDIYSGSWENYQMEGYGTLKNLEYGIYSGDFSVSKKSGNGTYIWIDGDNYIGQWQDDKIFGKGTYTFSDGGVLSGVFIDNSFYSGTYVGENTGVKYKLTYKDGKTHSAYITFSDGAVYSGEYSEMNFSGSGKMTYPNGDTYSGSYDNGKRDGSGIYTWKNGDNYDGMWSADTISGDGKYEFTNGDILSGTFESSSFVSGTYSTMTDKGSYCFTLENNIPTKLVMELNDGLKYNGGLLDDKFSDNGTITYKNGDVYTGGFVNGKRSGTGTYTWSSGEKYEGNWSDDKMSGKGTYYYTTVDDGYKLEGIFVNGVPDGECKYYESEYKSYSTFWTNGNCKKVTE